MKKIANILKEYSISKDELLCLLKKHTWKVYSNKTTRIWDSTFEIIKPYLENPKTNFSNSSEFNYEEKNSKVLTSHDIEEVDFLATTLWVKHTIKEEKFRKNKEKFKQPGIKDKKSKKDKSIVKKKEQIENVKFNKKEQFYDESVKKKWEVKKLSKDKKDFYKKEKLKNQKSSFRVEKKKQLEEKKSQKSVSKFIKKEERKPKISDTLKKKEKITMWDTITVKELSEKIWIHVTEVIKKFILNWMPVGINSSVDFDTVVLLADEFWVKVEQQTKSSDLTAIFEWNLREIINEKNQTIQKDLLVERPPIVTIMWHVDHGKTKLLDYIRKTDIVSKEAGGITQSIWASQITYNWKKITFIDTPWHELFTAMRARGAKITDIAVIVVAADEWVKAQTVEAINHAKDAWIAILVAITKIDKPNANIEMVKSQMSEQGLIPEERGGDIPFIALSSVTWEWVDELLEYILLQAEMLELKYNPKAPAVWVVLESSKDPKAWTIATLLVMTWTLKKRDPIIAYNVYGKIKLMKDWIWKIVREVKWWDPVQVMWFETVPQSWRIFEVVNSEKEAQKQVEKIRDMIKKTEQKSILSNFLDKMKAWETVELKVVLKAWDFGWLEALKYAMNKVKLPEGVKLKIIHEEVWHVKESDVTLAEASWAFIFGFDSAINSSLKKKLEQKKVTFKNFTIIYELLDYIEKLATWMIEKEAEEVYVWQLEVLAIFYKKWNDMIIWWKVIDGLVKNWAHFMLRRWEDELWWWKVTSVKIEQENVSEVKSWRECWIRVRTGKKIKEWDILEFYIYEKQ